MGQRFQFPDGIGGKVVSQVHAVHGIQTIGDGLGHWLTFGTNETLFATAEWVTENQTIALQSITSNGDGTNTTNYVSVGGLGWLTLLSPAPELLIPDIFTVTPEKTGWNFAAIDPVPL